MGNFGIIVHPYFLNVALPIGISFYTFQSISYTVDVYRGKLQACKNFLDFSLYVSFFPQLVAGPIERGTRLLPQILNSRSINKDNIIKKLPNNITLSLPIPINFISRAISKEGLAACILVFLLI